MLRIAAWHEHMTHKFNRAAQQPQSPFPRSEPHPPTDWRGATSKNDAVTR